LAANPYKLLVAISSIVLISAKLKQKQNIHAHYDLGNDFFPLQKTI